VATRIDYAEQRRLDKTNTLTLQSKLSYEYVNQRFRPLERFRNVEFTRDWNVLSSESPQDEHLATASLSLSKQQLGKIDYQFGTYLRGSSFSGRQHIASVSGAKNGYRLLLKGDVMSQSSQLFSSTYYRPYLEFEKQLKRLQQATIGTRYLVEHNNLRDAASDSLSKTAFSFDALTVYLKTRNDATNQFAVEYTHRYDRAAKENAFATATIGNTVSMNATINSIKQQEIKLTAAYRTMDIVDSSITLLKPDETSLGRIEYGFSAAKGLLSGNVLYEFGSGQEQKREFAYFEVPAGQGMYVWRDYNKDSLKQLNEFELAIFPDEKRYIKVFTPTNQYVKAKYSQYNQMISINPRAYFGSTQLHGLSKLISLFFLQSAVQLNNRFIGDNGIQQYNPFIRYRGNDSLLINSASSIINSIFFNRFNNTWGVDYVNTLNGGRTLLNYGIDARRNTDHLLRGRLNASKQIAVTAAVKTGIRNFSSAFLENRAYQIQYQSVEPALTFLFRQNQLRIQTGYKYDERHNDASFGGESAYAHHINLEVKYNIISSGALSSRFTYAGIVFDGIENSGVGYAMMDGLLNGRNLLWQATFNKRVSKNIEMNLEYEGRKSGTGNVIHTGRASVRAIF
jgi:hypothetical protein